MSTLNTRRYWEDRLGEDWSLQSVGFRRLGLRFNEWAYRLRAERFDDVLAQHVADVGKRTVLDVGSGTGFYIDAWQRAGVESVQGVDLTEAAVGKLRSKHPDVEFIRADVSTGVPNVASGSVDIVSAMDVLFHITEDDRFAMALAEVARMLKPGGLFIWSDLFLHGPERRLPHVSWRSLYRTESLLDRAGFEVVDRTPMFVTMNEPHDTRFGVARAAWYGLMGLASQSERLGDAVGHATYLIDKRLTRRLAESPTTEIMICRLRPSA